MTKAANNRSSIYRGSDGFWHGWVSFGAASDGRRRRKHVQAPTKREAAEKVKRLERQRDGGYAGDRPLTVTEWLDAWTVTRLTAGVRAKTLEGYRADRRHIVRAIGTVRLDRLTAEHVDKLWLSILAAGVGPATCAHVRRTLSAALNSAVERGHLARNPVMVSRPPRYDAPEVEPLSAADARKVLGVAAGRRNAARWSVALALGLRQGEALGLRWSDVNLDEGRLTVRAQLQHLPWQHGCAAPEATPTCERDPGRCPSRHGGGPVFVPVKSAAGRRVLALPAPDQEVGRNRHGAASHHFVWSPARARYGPASPSGLTQRVRSPVRRAVQHRRRCRAAPPRPRGSRLELAFCMA